MTLAVDMNIYPGWDSFPEEWRSRLTEICVDVSSDALSEDTFAVLCSFLDNNKKTLSLRKLNIVVNSQGKVIVSWCNGVTWIYALISGNGVLISQSGSGSVSQSAVN